MTRLSLHPHIASDVQAVARHYQGVGGTELADQFYAKLRRMIERVAERPGSFAPRGPGLRRANLTRFPYHLLFRVHGDTIRVLVLRHHRRHPAFGTHRR